MQHALAIGICHGFGGFTGSRAVWNYEPNGRTAQDIADYLYEAFGSNYYFDEILIVQAANNPLEGALPRPEVVETYVINDHYFPLNESKNNG
jgi:hypothetical protein